jgi:4-hydroxy-tetrahydrodipicolinate synthase
MSLEWIKNKIVGPIAYPTTPFKKSGKKLIDEDSFRKQIRFLIDNRISVIVPCGGTGEFFSLGFSEWHMLVEVALEEVEGKDVIIMPSVGGGITGAIKMAQSAEELGCKIIQLTFLDPMFGVTEDGIYEYNRQIANSVSIGVMPYKTKNIPMSIELAKRLCKMKNAVVFKEESGDIGWFRDFMLEMKDSIVGVCGGGEALAPHYLLLGAKAFTTGIANLFPHLSLKLYQATVEKKWDEILDIQAKLRPLTKMREMPGRMIPVIKEGLKIMGLVKEVYSRPPIVPLKEKEKRELEDILRALEASKNLQP